MARVASVRTSLFIYVRQLLTERGCVVVHKQGVEELRGDLSISSGILGAVLGGYSLQPTKWMYGMVGGSSPKGAHELGWASGFCDCSCLTLTIHLLLNSLCTENMTP